MTHRPLSAAVRQVLALPLLGLLLLPDVTLGQAPTEVFVLATLYQRHATTPAYGHDTLREIIRRIDPAVVVLDVSPAELRTRTVHPSKAEYPAVIFPLLESKRYQAYAGEPDEPTFSAIVTQLGTDLKRFRADQPVQAQADQAFNEATYVALAALWGSPAAVNSTATDEVLQARRVYQDHMAGPGVAEAWRQWNAHAVSVVRRAVEAHPGQRLLVLIGVENCGPLRAALQDEPTIRLIDMETWLETS